MSKSINEWADEVHELAKSKGWWDGAIHNIPEKIALIHSELSEALEEYRTAADGTLSDHTMSRAGKPEGFAIELADTVIRCLDLAARMGIDLEAAIERKHAYNKTRPVRHGGKRC